jgi:hypothetical protein
MTTTPDTPLDRATRRLVRFERTARRQRAINIILAVALVISTSGWWLTARDQSATRRNGDVADCRATELAITLDAFRVIVAPRSTDAEIDEAAASLGRQGDLVGRYDDCEPE